MRVIRSPAVGRPRTIDVSRLGVAPLDARDAFVLQLSDGTLTIAELADVRESRRQKVERILTRLCRLGIVAM